MLQRCHRVFKHQTVATMFTRSSFQSLTLRSFQTRISPTTILQPQPWSVHAPMPRLNSSMFATAAHEFHAPRLNSVRTKRTSVMDKWKEMDVVPDVKDYIDGEYVKASMSVRAYHSDMSVDVNSLIKKYRPNYVCGSGDRVVLRFATPSLKTFWTDDISYMMVFDYGSVILLNVRDSEISDRLKIVKASKCKIPFEPDLELVPENAPLRIMVYRSNPYCDILLEDEEGGSQLSLCMFKYIT